MADPELTLLIDCCRASFAGGKVDLSAYAAVRWDRLLALAKRHRVEGLCWQGLGAAQQEVPLPIADALAKAARATVEQGMRMAVEARRILQMMEAAGIEVLFIKGLTLAKLAYGDPFRKMSLDIDLLVDPTAIEAAVALLRGAGYRPVTPSGTGDLSIVRWHEVHKESVWVSGETSIQIDLHSRLADHPRLLAEANAGSPRQIVTIADGVELPTFARGELIAYLSVHGASSAWYRLKWVSDLAALLSQMPAEDIETLWLRSAELGAGRAITQALLIVDRTFGLDLPENFRDRLAESSIDRWLGKISLAQLRSDREPLDRPGGTALIHLAQLYLVPGWGAIAADFKRQARQMAANRS